MNGLIPHPTGYTYRFECGQEICGPNGEPLPLAVVERAVEDLNARRSNVLTANKKTVDGLHLRWMIRRDMPEVFAIENANFEFPWCEDDFIRCLRNRNCIGFVAEHKERIVGYMIYELHKRRIELLNIAVHASMHRQGVGFAMIRKLHGKLTQQNRRVIGANVFDKNLDAQLFFKAVGFKAIGTHCDTDHVTGREFESYRFVLEE